MQRYSIHFICAAIVRVMHKSNKQQLRIEWLTDWIGTTFTAREVQKLPHMRPSQIKPDEIKSV